MSDANVVRLDGNSERADSKGPPRYRGYRLGPHAKRHLSVPRTRTWPKRGLRASTRWRDCRTAGGSAYLARTMREAVERSLNRDRIRGDSRSRRAPYKPSTRRGYERQASRPRTPVSCGPYPLGEADTSGSVQVWTDSLDGAPSTIRNAVAALRALYGWAIPRGHRPGQPHARPAVALRREGARPDRLTRRGRRLDRGAPAARPSVVRAGGLCRPAAARFWRSVGGDRPGRADAARRAKLGRESREFVKPKSKAGTAPSRSSTAWTCCSPIIGC